jgi:hypothetical protein
MPLQSSEHNIKDERVFILNAKNRGEDMYTNNALRAVMDPETCLWILKMEKGVLPGGLKGKWTSFPRLYNHVQTYLKHKGVEIVGVKD